jgi:hypothetical protein
MAAPSRRATRIRKGPDRGCPSLVHDDTEWSSPESFAAACTVMDCVLHHAKLGRLEGKSYLLSRRDQWAETPS